MENNTFKVKLIKIFLNKYFNPFITKMKNKSIIHGNQTLTNNFMHLLYSGKGHHHPRQSCSRGRKNGSFSLKLTKHPKP